LGIGFFQERLLLVRIVFRVGVNGHQPRSYSFLLRREFQDFFRLLNRLIIILLSIARLPLELICAR